MYSMRTHSRDVRLWRCDADKFVMHIKSGGREPNFKTFQKQKDLDMLNALARTLYSASRAYNTDGAHNAVH